MVVAEQEDGTIARRRDLVELLELRGAHRTVLRAVHRGVEEHDASAGQLRDLHRLIGDGQPVP